MNTPQKTKAAENFAVIREMEAEKEKVVSYGSNVLRLGSDLVAAARSYPKENVYLRPMPLAEKEACDLRRARISLNRHTRKTAAKS